MKTNNRFRINKVPLEEFISLLTDFYDKGVDFIDIVGGEIEQSGETNEMDIVIFPEYYRKEQVNEKLNEEDIERLL